MDVEAKRSVFKKTIYSFQLSWWEHAWFSFCFFWWHLKSLLETCLTVWWKHCESWGNKGQSIKGAFFSELQGRNLGSLKKKMKVHWSIISQNTKPSKWTLLKAFIDSLTAVVLLKKKIHVRICWLHRFQHEFFFLFSFFVPVSCFQPWKSNSSCPLFDKCPLLWTEQRLWNKKRGVIPSLMDHNKCSVFIIPPIRSLLTEIFRCLFFFSISLFIQATKFPPSSLSKEVKVSSVHPCTPHVWSYGR